MEPRDVFLLETIADYCHKIAAYLDDRHVDQDAFLSDPYHQDTCAFYCLQIGENANSLSSTYVALHPEMEWRKIVGFRNVIAHEYGSIDSELLWHIITENIPKLHEYCAGQI